ncbi:hypothetical protein LINPERPRIM_LOCUS11508 [Linum perenne]
MVAEHTNNKLMESMSNGEVADVFSELNSFVEALTISNEEIKMKEKLIVDLMAEVISKETLAKLVMIWGRRSRLRLRFWIRCLGWIRRLIGEGKRKIDRRQHWKFKKKTFSHWLIVFHADR